MSNVYLITGASSDVGCALIRRLWQPGDVFIAQGAGDLGGLAALCQEHPGSIRTYDVDLTNDKALEVFIADVQASCPAPTHFVHLPALRVADLETDTRVLKEAQDAAAEVLAADPDLARPEHCPLLEKVRRLFAEDPDRFN